MRKSDLTDTSERARTSFVCHGDHELNVVTGMESAEARVVVFPSKYLSRHHEVGILLAVLNLEPARAQFPL